MNLFLIDEPKVSLVNQRRRLQRMFGTLPVHVLVGQPVQFF